MSTFLEQFERIKTLILSTDKPNKSYAYSTLLLLQEHSSDELSAIQIIADNSQCLVSEIIADIFDEDEEIAVQALKCLGFMIYHPSIAATIPVDNANRILESLVKIISATKMKPVCNLGVWCISIQQLTETFLASHLHSLLTAIAHGLDNPFGSLSTTYEAIQAVMKLAGQLSEKMRELSHIWVPPLYRRLLSVQKRERDMSERCLLKIRSTILPPSLDLSKALVQDMKQNLHDGMKQLLNQGMKVQAIQAWGWFIRFLGSHAVRHRHLINEMLKIPEQTFSDHDAQVQIASLVAWEGLIDALIRPPFLDNGANAALENDIQKVQTPFKKNSGETEGRSFLKSIKLIMMPIIGIVSSKCDFSVLSACMNTWLYLLHKLHTSINYPSIFKLVMEPIFGAVFQSGPDSKRIWCWNFIVDMLDDFILVKCRHAEGGGDKHVGHLMDITTAVESSLRGKGSWKQSSFNWFPWDLSQLDFLMNMISIIICQASTSTATLEKRSSPSNAALRLYRSVLKGVRTELKKSSITYETSMSCLGMILNFNKRICGDATTQGRTSDELLCTSLLYIKAAVEELEPSVLGSPLYRVVLDFKYVECLPSLDYVMCAKLHNLISVDYMAMVSPIIYLIVLHFSVVVHAISSSLQMSPNLQEVRKFFKLLFSSYDVVEILLPILGLLYRHVGFNYLKIWTSISESLKDCINDVDNLSSFEMDPNNACCRAISYLLSYPFFACQCSMKASTTSPVSGSIEQPSISLQGNHELGHVIKVWKHLSSSWSTLQFMCSVFENLCSTLSEFIDERIITDEPRPSLDLSHKNSSSDIFVLSGTVAISILEQILREISSHGKGAKSDGDCVLTSAINSSLGFASRFMKLSFANIRTDQLISFSLTSSVFYILARLVSYLQSKQQIVSFMEITCSGLLPWLSLVEISDQYTTDQLQLLWVEILHSLCESQPPITFDSSFLKFHAPFLEKTLNHPNPSISDTTITFWNSTYGEQNKLEYPQILVNVLDKLSRTGRLKLNKRCPEFLANCSSKLVSDPRRFRVTTVQNMNSKRIEFREDAVTSAKNHDRLLTTKRKRLELTEHQKEVRRAQRGRERDYGGNGLGIRTYTNLYFSQGNEDSQESQDLRNQESIMETLGRSG